MHAQPGRSTFPFSFGAQFLKCFLCKPIEEEQLLFLVRSVRQTINSKKIEQENNSLLQDAENNTGYLLDRYPEGCLITLQLGGDIDSIGNALLRTKIKPRHYLLVLPRSAAMDIDNLPFSIESLGITEYSDGALSAAIVRAELAAYSFFNHPGQHLFFALPDQDSSKEIEQFCSAVFPKTKNRFTAISATFAAIPKRSAFQHFSACGVFCTMHRIHGSVLTTWYTNSAQSIR